MDKKYNIYKIIFALIWTTFGAKFLNIFFIYPVTMGLIKILEFISLSIMGPFMPFSLQLFILSNRLTLVEAGALQLIQWIYTGVFFIIGLEFIEWCKQRTIEEQKRYENIRNIEI